MRTATLAASALAAGLGLAALYSRARAAAPASSSPMLEGDVAHAGEAFDGIRFPSFTDMKLSPEGLDAIKQHEGFRADVYDDGAGFLTIGYGHKLTPDEIGVLTVVSFAQATQLLRRDVQAAEAAVNDAVTVPLVQGEFDALVSLVFNIGAGAFRRSTLLRKLNAEDRAGAAREFGRWVFAGGKRMAGLVSRRAAEAAMFRGTA